MTSDRDVDDDDRTADRLSWHDRPPVVMAAGVAGLLLLGLLVYAVIHITDDRTRPPGAPSSDLETTRSRSATSGTPTPSYTLPRPQTSDNDPTVSAPAPAPPPESDEPEPETTTDTPTTTTNPYAPTTTQNADAI